MDKVIQRYSAFIKLRLNLKVKDRVGNLNYWQDELFHNFLVYCIPVSLLAILPGVYIAIQDGFPIIAAVDISCFLLICVATFFSGISLIARKIIIISVFYFLSIFLINSLGYLGPGVFYLFFVTMLVALILPVRFAYWSICFNGAILSCFAVIIKLKIFNSSLIEEYTPGKWIAFSSNLIFASIIIVVLIDRIFKGLQQTIINQSELQEKYKNIFDKSPLPMWLFDTETFRFLDVNDAAIRHYGYNKSEFLSMTIKDIRTAKCIPEVEEIVKTNKISGAYYDGNSQHVKKNGETIYVKIESNVLQFNERPARLVLATDVTAQIKNEVEIVKYNHRIKESESNLKAIFESALDGFVLLDAEYRIKTFNSKASEFMRLNKEHYAFKIGCSIFDYVEDQNFEYFKQIINKVFWGQTVDFDRKYTVTDGTKLWIRYTLTPVREGNTVIGACISGRDITVRKLYLKHLERQNKAFREISWIQSHLVRAPLARIMGLMPLFIESKDENENIIIKNYLEVATKDLDDVISQVTEKAYNTLQKIPGA